jgi:hypothetical protein
LEIVEVGEQPSSFFYPLSAEYGVEDESFQLRVLAHRLSDPIEIWHYEEVRDSYRLLQAIGPEASPGPVTEVRLHQDGLYRLSGGELDFLLPLRRPTLPVRVEGQFSSLMAEILPGVQPGAEGTLLADIPWQPEVPGSADRAIGDRHGILTLIPDAEAEAALFLRPYIQPLKESLSQPAYAELPVEIPVRDQEDDRLIFLDPARLRDAGTPLVYLSALWSRRPDGPVIEPGAALSGAKLSATRSGSTSFAYGAADRTLVVNLPPEEFFPIDPGIGSSSGYPSRKPAKPALLPALLLLALYLLKLLYLARLHGHTSQRDR